MRVWTLDRFNMSKNQKSANQKPQSLQQKRRTRSFYSENSCETNARSPDWGEKDSRTKDAENKILVPDGGDRGKKQSSTNRGDDGPKRRTRSFYLEHVDENENHPGLKNGNETASSNPESDGNVKRRRKLRTKKEKIPDGTATSKNRKTRSFNSELVDVIEKLNKPQHETPSKGMGSDDCNKDRISKKDKKETPDKVRCSRNDYNLPPPDENTCELSNDWADCCKTLCKICDQSYGLTQMRFHTKKEHNLQITKYKEIYGPFVIIDVVYHKCEICGKLVLLDSDFLGAHIKNGHKMKESQYYDLYMVRAQGFKSSKSMEKAKTRSKLDRMLDFEFDFNKLEYDCNVKDCKHCGQSTSVDPKDTAARDVCETNVDDVNDTSADDKGTQVSGAKAVNEGESKDFINHQDSGEASGVNEDHRENKFDENNEYDPAKVISYDSTNFNENFSSTTELELYAKRQSENMEVDEESDTREDESNNESSDNEDSDDSLDYTVISVESDGTGNNIDGNTDDDDDVRKNSEITLDTDEFDASMESDNEKLSQDFK